MTHTTWGAIVGFLAAILPAIVIYLFSMWREWWDHRTQMAMLTLQAKLASEYGGTRIEEAFGYGAGEVQREDQQEARREYRKTLQGTHPLIYNLIALVRPGVTLAFFVLYAELALAVQFGFLTTDDFLVLWEAPMEALFATVIAFWFGTRAVAKRSQ